MKALKIFEPCGRTIGHGTICEAYSLCEQCAIIEKQIAVENMTYVTAELCISKASLGLQPRNKDDAVLLRELLSQIKGNLLDMQHFIREKNGSE